MGISPRELDLCTLLEVAAVIGVYDTPTPQTSRAGRSMLAARLAAAERGERAPGWDVKTPAPPVLA